MRIIPYMLVIMTIACAAHAADYEIPDDVSLINICFNHTTGSTSDALRLKYDHTTIVPAPEWTVTNTESIGYVAGTPADLLIEITRSDFDIDSLKVRLVTDSTSIGTYSDTWFTFSGPPEELDYLRNVSGGIPSGVGVNPLKLEWYIVQVNDDQPFQNPVLFALTRHEYYAVLDTPQAPMDSAWVDVLAYACDWAAGETTAVGVMEDVAIGINSIEDQQGELTYGAGTSGYWWNATNFKLKKFFDFLADSTNVCVTCPVTSALNVIFSRALGLTSIREYFNPGDFVNTQKILLIGKDENEPDDWEAYYWDNHLTAKYSNKIFDPCIKISESNAYVPTNMMIPAYEDSVWGQNVGNTTYIFSVPGVCNY